MCLCGPILSIPLHRFMLACVATKVTSCLQDLLSSNVSYNCIEPVLSSCLSFLFVLLFLPLFEMKTY